MKVEIWIFSWKRYLTGTKHCYVKIFENGELKVQEGGKNDSQMFFTQRQAQDWADDYVKNYIKKHYPEQEIEWKYVGDVKMKYQYSHEGD